MSELIMETETEIIAFEDNGHLLHTHKHTYAQRRSLNAYPNYEAAKSAVEADLGHVKWEEAEQ
jgi:hypothetical protein